MNYHGWAREHKSHPALHIGELPGRKSNVLYIDHGTVIAPLAYFTSPEQAAEAMAMLDYIILGLPFGENAQVIAPMTAMTAALQAFAKEQAGR
jgi:hypothetical protein